MAELLSCVKCDHSEPYSELLWIKCWVIDSVKTCLDECDIWLTKWENSLGEESSELAKETHQKILELINSFRIASSSYLLDYTWEDKKEVEEKVVKAVKKITHWISDGINLLWETATAKNMVLIALEWSFKEVDTLTKYDFYVNFFAWLSELNNDV